MAFTKLNISIIKIVFIVIFYNLHYAKTQSQIIYIPSTSGGGNPNVQVISLPRRPPVQSTSNQDDPLMQFTNAMQLFQNVDQLPSVPIPFFGLQNPPIIYANRQGCPKRDVVFCQGTTMELNCPQGTSITITASSYGRQNSSICLNNPLAPKLASAPTKYDNLNCILENTTQILQGICEGLQNCKATVDSRVAAPPDPAKATTDLFTPDPCPTIVKYLKTQYCCQGQPQTLVPIPSTNSNPNWQSG